MADISKRKVLSIVAAGAAGLVAKASGLMPEIALAGETPSSAATTTEGNLVIVRGSGIALAAYTTLLAFASVTLSRRSTSGANAATKDGVQGHRRSELIAGGEGHEST